MYKIAVVGDRDSVMGFRALGLDTYAVDTPEEGKERSCTVWPRRTAP